MLCHLTISRCPYDMFVFLLQMPFSSQSAAIFTAKAVCGRCDISCFVFSCWNNLVSHTTLQVGFLVTS